MGIDLVSIPEFAEQVDRPGTVFAETFTPGERRDAADARARKAAYRARDGRIEVPGRTAVVFVVPKE